MVSGGLAVTALAGCGGSDGGTEQSAQTEVSEGIKTAAEDNKVTTFALPDGPEESEIYVEPIADLPDDFIRGMDASAVLSLENSGVTYYNYEGKEQDVFETLAQSGVNYIRLRVGMIRMTRMETGTAAATMTLRRRSPLENGRRRTA